MAVSTGLVLYYHPYSFYSQKVVMTLHEKNVAFEPVIINITKGEQYSSTFLKINPRGEVPVLQDAGKIIPDSSRIIDYLEDNFSNDAEINSAQNLRQNADLNPEVKDTLFKKADFQEKKHNLVTNKEEYMKILKTVEDALEKIELELSNHKKENTELWLCSEDFSVADISLTILLVRLDSLGLDSYFWTKGKRPNIEEYYFRVQQKQSFKNSIPDLFFHLKVLFNSQTPLGIGVGVVGMVGFVAGAVMLLKRIIF